MYLQQTKHHRQEGKFKYKLTLLSVGCNIILHLHSPDTIFVWANLAYKLKQTVKKNRNIIDCLLDVAHHHVGSKLLQQL